MEEEVLRVQNLNVELDKEGVLKDLSFRIRKGETLVVLGPNGAGKTVLLRTLLGFLPYEGSIQWKKGLKKSYVPTRLSLEKSFPLTVREFFKLKKISKKNAKELLNLVGLSAELSSKRIGYLSTGQFQRILVAWALGGEPDVLLFDEPVSGIDIAGQENIYQLLKKIQKEREITIIFVSHDLNIVYRLADNVLCLNKKTLCYGVPREIISPQVLSQLYGGKIKFYKHLHG